MRSRTGGAHGTSTANAPFCSSGTAVDLAVNLLNGSDDDTRRYTCGDGSGSLTLVQEMFEEHKSPWVNTWRIVAGTGRYADLRGRGSYEGEFLSGDPDIVLTVVFRSTFRGLVDFDSVAPAITVSKARITKLTRPARTYVIHLALSVRDRNTTSYVVKAIPEGGEIPVAAKSGKTTSGKVGLTFRLRLSRSVRVLVFEISATDEVGNVIGRDALLKLPR